MAPSEVTGVLCGTVLLVDIKSYRCFGDVLLLSYRKQICRWRRHEVIQSLPGGENSCNITKITMTKWCWLLRAHRGSSDRVCFKVTNFVSKCCWRMFLSKLQLQQQLVYFLRAAPMWHSQVDVINAVKHLVAWKWTACHRYCIENQCRGPREGAILHSCY